MKRLWGPVVIAAVLLAAGLAPAADKTAAKGPQGSCETCHKTVKETAGLAHGFGDWANSVHGKAGVACDACHGGDPSRKDMEGAHAGLIASTDAKSPVYFTNIPATCGRCHDAELSAFKQSKHYRELERSGRGPNCVTCHGSMANHIMAPKDLDTTCALCHRKPTQAFAAEVALEESRAALRRLDEAVKKAPKGAKGLEAAKAAGDKAKALRSSAVAVWHTFEMDKVVTQGKEAARIARDALADLKKEK